MAEHIATDTCPICFEQQVENPTVTLKCGCSSCSSCLTSWILSQIADPSYNIGYSMLCISSDCKKCFSLQEIQCSLPKDSFMQINEALLQVYLIKTKDIRKCPNQKCPYAGVIQTWIKCSEGIQCENCETEWKDKQQHFSTSALFMRSLQHKTYNKIDLISDIWKWINTKKCPGCKVNIEKNGGCEHVTCFQCGFRFCWVCLEENSICNDTMHFFEGLLYPIAILLGVLIALIMISLLVYYRNPFIMTLADWTFFPVFFIVKAGVLQVFDVVQPIILWKFYTFWKLAVVIICDFCLRTLLFDRNVALLLKGLCSITLIVCIWITHHGDAYQSMALTGLMEALVVFVINTIIKNVQVIHFLRILLNKSKQIFVKL